MVSGVLTHGLDRLHGRDPHSVSVYTPQARLVERPPWSREQLVHLVHIPGSVRVASAR